jgi:hypothetical protein
MLSFFFGDNSPFCSEVYESFHNVLMIMFFLWQV